MRRLRIPIIPRAVITPSKPKPGKPLSSNCSSNATGSSSVLQVSPPSSSKAQITIVKVSPLANLWLTLPSLVNISAVPSPKSKVYVIVSSPGSEAYTTKSNA